MTRSTRSTLFLLLILILLITPIFRSVSFAIPQDQAFMSSATLIVNSAADSGLGTLRQALHDARRGNIITFDPDVFSPRRPTTIAITSALPEIWQGKLTIDGSNAGVILDGSGIGRKLETLLLDDISLKLDGGPNLISNGDFSSGLGHWRHWDEGPGVSWGLEYRDYNSPPHSYTWATTAQAGESHVVYDRNDTSYPLPNRAYYWPYYRESTVWIPLVGNGMAELRIWYRYGGFSVWLNALFIDGYMDNIYYKWFERRDDWSEARVSQEIPIGVVAIALELGFSHSELWVNGLSIRSSENIIRGLQIINFPGSCIALYGGAQNNVIGGDRNTGAGPMGQGNLMSGDGNFGIGLWDSATSFNIIKGNYIGTDISGTSAWGKRRDGIHINGPHHNKIIDNLICGNSNGIYVANNNDSSNIFTGNRIGTDQNGILRIGNRNSGMIIDRASYNVIGPGNIISFNGGHGIGVCTNSMHNTIIQNSIYNNNGNGISVRSNSLYNTFTQNSIYNNSGEGIWMCDHGNKELAAPTIIDFDLSAGTVLGKTGANYVVEIFSDGNYEGSKYEGRTKADDMGFFLLDKGTPFIGPRLTATASDEEGDTSKFSMPTDGNGTSLYLQYGNDLCRELISTKRSEELEDNRIGGDYVYDDLANKETILQIGFKWIRLALSGKGDPSNWQNVEMERGNYVVDPKEESFIKSLADNGVNIVLNLGVGAGDGRPDTTRFSAEEEMERYASYVLFMVKRFKGCIRYYEIWNEPDTDTQWGGISVERYANLIKRVVPIIRQEDPDAKVVIGATGGYWVPNFLGYGAFLRYTLNTDYLEALLRSGVAQLVDAISWHPFYGQRPDDPYYESYPLIVQGLRSLAASQGFRGELFAEEIDWRSGVSQKDGTTFPFTERIAAKYLSRAIIMHLGLNVTVSTAGQSDRSGLATLAIRTLCTVMAGAKNVNFSVEIKSEKTNIKKYAFSLPNGDRLIAFWADDLAAEEDPGISSTMILDCDLDQIVTCVDTLHGFEQEVNKSIEDGKTIIQNLLLRDYPLIIHISSTKRPSTVRTLSISTVYQELSVKTSRLLYFPITIENTATSRLTFHLSPLYVPEGWNLTFRTVPDDLSSISHAFIEEGEASLLYLVAVPPRNVGMGTFNFTVLVEPEMGASQNLTFTAKVTSFYDLDLKLSTLFVRVRPGGFATITATVNNTGATRLTNVTIETSAPPDWKVVCVPDYLDTLAPGSFGTIMLLLKPPNNAGVGEYAIGLRSVSGVAESTQKLLRVDVQTSSISSWGVGAIPMLIAVVVVLLVYLKFARSRQVTELLESY